MTRVPARGLADGLLGAGSATSRGAAGARGAGAGALRPGVVPAGGLGTTGTTTTPARTACARRGPGTTAGALGTFAALPGLAALALCFPALSFAAL